MFDDVFDDAAVRRAFESSLAVRARAFGGGATPPRWSFERTRYGLRRIEVCPIGLYAAVCRSEADCAELRAFIERERSASVASVRININPLEARADQIAQHAQARGFQVERHETHVLPIGASIEAMRKDYHTTKRHQVVRAAKVQSAICVASDAAQLDDYFAVYAASLARWGRSGFVYPRALFAALLSCPSVRFWMNYVHGRLACAMVVFYCRSYALYWQGVSKIDADQRQAFPMVVLMDAVLQDLVKSGISHLNLGASDGLPNVKRFKEEFGARAVAYPALVYESPLWRTLKGARRLWQGSAA